MLEKKRNNKKNRKTSFCVNFNCGCWLSITFFFVNSLLVFVSQLCLLLLCHTCNIYFGRLLYGIINLCYHRYLVISIHRHSTLYTRRNFMLVMLDMSTFITTIFIPVRDGNANNVWIVNLQLYFTIFCI